MTTTNRIYVTHKEYFLFLDWVRSIKDRYLKETGHNIEKSIFQLNDLDLKKIAESDDFIVALWRNETERWVCTEGNCDLEFLINQIRKNNGLPEIVTEENILNISSKITSCMVENPTLEDIEESTSEDDLEIYAKIWFNWTATGSDEIRQGRHEFTNKDRSELLVDIYRFVAIDKHSGFSIP